MAYQIRYDSAVRPQTLIKFVTDGILLQEMKQDLQLSQYSAVIVDEAHERSVFTDICLGLLSLAVRSRRRAHDRAAAAAALKDRAATDERPLPPLKLIIMSAIMRASDFCANPRLFGWLGRGVSPPLVTVEGRQYDVLTRFSKQTPSNFVLAAYRKVILPGLQWEYNFSCGNSYWN